MITYHEIEAWRVAHKITKKELARRLGITYTFLVDILNGKRALSAATALKFQQLSGKDVKACSYDDVMAYAVRLTPAEYHQLCKIAGKPDMSPAEVEKAVRDLLQQTWDELAATVPNVVENDLDAAEADKRSQ